MMVRGTERDAFLTVDMLLFRHKDLAKGREINENAREGSVSKIVMGDVVVVYVLHVGHHELGEKINTSSTQLGFHVRVRTNLYIGG